MDENNILYEEKKEKVLEFINSKDYFPMGLKDIEVIMQVPHEDREIFSNIIEDLEKEGKIIKSKKGKIMKPEELKLYVGQLTGNSRGFGFVKVDGLEEDIFIPANAMNNAMHKDTVMVKLNPSSRGKRQEGEVVKIIKRGMDGIVGTYQSVKGYGFVIPDDKKIADDIFISSGDSMGAVTGHKVVVKITKPAGQKRKNPEGKIIEILGHIDDPGVDILSIIRQFNLPTDFPEDVMKQTESIPSVIDQEEAKKREDLRDVTMVTIDGEDAKDLDDAVSVEVLENGNYKLGVYIADVSHYVTENSPLDKEAYKRGTSVYLVDRVIPMLPHKLSNGICSLNAGEDRFTLCCIMEIDKKGTVINSDIKKAVINVNRRMSYNVVYDLLTNENSEYLKEYEDLMPMFKNMEKLRNILFTSITRSRAWVRVCGVGEKMQQIQKEYNQCVTNDYDLHFRIPTDEELKKARRLNRERTSTEKRILETTKDNINELIDNIEKGTVDSELLPELNKLMELLKRG